MEYGNVYMSRSHVRLLAVYMLAKGTTVFSHYVSSIKY
jgi:hypothetical protein